MQTNSKPDAGKQAPKTRTARPVGETPTRVEPASIVRTVLIASCGWPTEDSVPKSHRRAARR